MYHLKCKSYCYGWFKNFKVKADVTVLFEQTRIFVIQSQTLPTSNAAF